MKTSVIFSGKIIVSYLMFVMSFMVSESVQAQCTMTDQICAQDVHPDALVYYKDGDNDGYGDPNDCGCYTPATKPSNYVRDNTDCDDDDGTQPSTDFWYDNDNDGLGDPNTKTPFLLCNPSSQWVRNSDDCDDSNGTLGTVSTPSGVSVSNPSCGTASLSHNGPSYWYWQSSATGTSTSDNSNPKSVSSGSVLYLREKIGDCWSDALTVNFDTSTPTINLPGVTDTERCGPGQIQIQANYLKPSGQPDASGIKVYDSNDNYITTVSPGSPFTTSITTTSQFKFAAIVNGCEGPMGTAMAYVYTAPSPGSITGIQTICYDGNPLEITSSEPASGGNGTFSYQWFSSTDGGSNWSEITGATSNTYDPPGNQTVSKLYRREVTSCGFTEVTNSIAITVNPQLDPGVITSTQTICYDTSPAQIDNSVLATGGDGGYTYGWEWSDTGSAPWTPVTGVNSIDYDPTESLTANRWYRRSVISCNATFYTPPVEITVRPDLAVPTGADIFPVCDGENITVSITPGTGGNTIRWYTSSTGGTHIADGDLALTNVTASSTYYAATYNTTTQCESTQRKSAAVAVTGQITYYLDGDGDGFAVSTLDSCSNPGTGYTDTVLPLGDCDDDNGDINPNTEWYLDVDNDDHSPIGYSVYIGCVPPNNNYDDYTIVVLPIDDCDDTNPDVSAQQIWYLDKDHDGYPANSNTWVQCDNPGTATGTEDNYRFGPNLGYIDCDDDDPLVKIYTWYDDSGDLDGLGDPNGPVEVSCNPPSYGGPWVNNNSDSCPTVYDPENYCGLGSNLNVPYNGPNYVYSRNYQEPRNTVDSLFISDDGVIQSVSYFDDIGRPIQQIGIEHSPEDEVLNIKTDIITYKEYDGYGRMVKDYLPYASTNNNLGILRTNPLTETLEFYNTTEFENTSNPYSEKKFDETLLNRIEKLGAPGSTWQIQEIGDDHSIEFDYLTNGTNEVRRFEVLLAGGPTLVLDEGGTSEFYSVGELRKTITFDENHVAGSGKNHSIEEFTDKQGRVILKRTFADIPARDLNDDGDTLDEGEAAVPEAPHETFYVYDDYGNLSFVLSPLMKAATSSLSAINSSMADLGYQYIYDDRNRLIEKQIPGKGREYIVYNKLDQPILTQDAMMRAVNNNNLTNDQWLFTKYDAFGRVAYTGMASALANTSRTAIQNEVNALTTDLWVSRTNGFFNSDNLNIYYDQGGYPDGTLTSQVVSISEIFTVNYYDNYNFDRKGSGTTSTAFGVASTSNTNGLSTGTHVKVLETTDWITTVQYYDEKGRVISSYSINEYLGTTDNVTSQLDFTGRALKVRSEHQRNGNYVVTLDSYTYDHVGRLLSQSQCIGDQTIVDSCPGGSSVSPNLPIDQPVTESRTDIATSKITLKDGFSVVATSSLTYKAFIDPNATGTGGSQELIAGNEYDEIGRLVIKNVGGALGAPTPLQTVNYEYNVRGWLKSINDDNLNDNILTLNADDLWGFKIKYDDIADVSKQLFNGNISQTMWSSKTENPPPGNPVSNQYIYEYDAMNRINSAYDNTGNYNVTGIVYDLNGNIQKLKRQGKLNDNPLSIEFGLMDDLTYSYGSSNKLLSVNDSPSSDDQEGFVDRVETTQEYYYDLNGNMIRDDNKGIASIDYNYLNRPTLVTIINSDHNGNLQYVYASNGMKISKNIGLTEVKEYSGKYVYAGGNSGSTLQYFTHSEGYVMPNGNGGYNYVYQYRDKSDNVRLSYSDSDNNGDISQSEIIEENNYYPYGLKHNGYNSSYSGNGNDEAQNLMYNGIEREMAFGLEIYEMPLRQYDPALGRFTQIDPVTHHNLSPYLAFDNNPVYWADPSGANSLSNIFESNLGADGLTSEQWLDLTRNGGGADPREVQRIRKSNSELSSVLKGWDESDPKSKSKPQVYGGEGQFLQEECPSCPEKIDLNSSGDEIIQRAIEWGRYILNKPNFAMRARDMIILKEDNRSNSLKIADWVLGTKSSLSTDRFEYEGARVKVTIIEHYYNTNNADGFVRWITDKRDQYDPLHRERTYTISFIGEPGLGVASNSQGVSIIVISFNDISVRNNVMKQIKTDPIEAKQTLDGY